MEIDRSDDLDIIRYHTPDLLLSLDEILCPHETLTCLLEEGKCFWEDIVERCATGYPLFELVSESEYVIMGQCLVLFVEIIDLSDDRKDFLDLSLIVVTSDARYNSGEHVYKRGK